MSAKNQAPDLQPRAGDEADQNAAAATQPPAPQRATTKRDLLLEQLAGVTTVMLNVSRDPIFTIRSNWIDNRSSVLFSVDRRNPSATFGRNGHPALADMPQHALEQISRAIALGTLIDTTRTGAPTRPQDYRPISGRIRVEKGMDPVKNSGLNSETLFELLKEPKQGENKDPQGFVLNRIRESYREDYRVLVALQYLEQCGQRRPRLLSTLEDMIQTLHDQRGIPLEN